jgi:hypothetical protein
MTDRDTEQPRPQVRATIPLNLGGAIAQTEPTEDEEDE